jgi:hypothetical protein
MTKKNKIRRTWLNHVGGAETPAENWMGMYCKEYLAENPDLSNKDYRIKILSALTPKQRLSIDALLEKEVESWRTTAHVYIEWSYAEGALEAFRNEDYTCSLIHRYLTSDKLNSIINKKR